MSLAELAMGKTRAQIAQRRIRLDDFFTDFDRLRTGRLTADRFRRVLTLHNIVLTEEEMNALIAAYQTRVHRVAGGVATAAPHPVDVRYVDFLAALRGEEPPRELLTTVYRRPVTLNSEEERQLEPVMRMLRHAISAHSINIVAPFKDLDPLHTGKVTNSQFQRSISFQHHMDERVLKLLEKKYGDGEGNMYYMMWCRDVDATLLAKEKLQAAVAATNTAPSSLFFNGSYTNTHLTAEELIRILREQFALYRLRCEDFMTDFDKFKTGYISAPQFTSALGRLKFVKFALTEENISALVTAYGDKSQPAGTPDLVAHIPEALVRVNYRNFLHDTNPKNFPVIGVDGKPSGNYFLSTHAPDVFMKNAEEQAQANRVLEKVARLVRTNRIFLSPVLRDFDRVKKAIYEHRTCTSSRFSRGLATQNLILPQEEINILRRKYTIPHADGSPSDEVNYYQFVQDVDPSQAQLPQLLATANGRGVVAQMQSEAELSRVSTSTDAVSVLVKIAQQAEERQLRVGEFFADYDPLRSSVIAKSQFISALSIAGFDLAEADIDALTSAFPAAKVRNHINVHDFLREVGAYAPMSVPAAIIGMPDMSTDYARTVQQRPCGGSSLLSENELRRLMEIQKRLRHDATSHSALLTPFFSDFDRFNHGKITKHKFLQALARHRFVINEEDSALLCRFYSPPGDVDMVDYRRFVCDVGDNECTRSNVKQQTAPTGSAAPLASTNATATGASSPNTKTAPLEASYTEVDLQAVLQKVCCFLQERQPRVSEFFPDGDELRHQHVTSTRFQHCISILGIRLSARELDILEHAFMNTMKDPGSVNYPAFVQCVRGMLSDGAGIEAVTERRMGERNALLSSAKSKGEAGSAEPYTLQETLLLATLAKIKRSLATRRTMSLPSFHEYDRTRCGHVKEGQFFACLLSLGVQLTPREAEVVCKAYSLGNGEMGYTRFACEVDDLTFSSVS